MITIRDSQSVSRNAAASVMTGGFVPITNLPNAVRANPLPAGNNITAFT